MTRFLNRYRVESARLHGYDYSAEGMYFITICTYAQIHYFGKIQNEQMFLNALGGIVKEELEVLHNRHSHLYLNAFVLMPNHLHMIVHLKNCRDAIHRVSPMSHQGGVTAQNNPMIQPQSISAIIRSYKAQCTKRIREATNEVNFRWQPRFHDRIIRDEQEYQRCQEYVNTNPIKWKYDRYSM